MLTGQFTSGRSAASLFASTLPSVCRVLLLSGATLLLGACKTSPQSDGAPADAQKPAPEAPTAPAPAPTERPAAAQPVQPAATSLHDEKGFIDPCFLLRETDAEALLGRGIDLIPNVQLNESNRQQRHAPGVGVSVCSYRTAEKMFIFANLTVFDPAAKPDPTILEKFVRQKKKTAGHGQIFDEPDVGTQAYRSEKSLYGYNVYDEKTGVAFRLQVSLGPTEPLTDEDFARQTALAKTIVERLHE